MLAGRLRTVGRESAHHYISIIAHICMDCVMTAGQRFGSAPKRKASLRERLRVSAHAHLSHEKRQDKRADDRTFHIIRGQAVMSGLSLGTVKSDSCVMPLGSFREGATVAGGRVRDGSLVSWENSDCLFPFQHTLYWGFVDRIIWGGIAAWK